PASRTRPASCRSTVRLSASSTMSASPAATSTTAAIEAIMSQIPETPEQTVRLLQIITGALVMGVLLMAGIAVLALGSLEAPSQGVVISGMGAAAAVVAFVLHLVIPPMAARQ